MEERITEFPYTAEGLALLVKELRKPYGCPWDKEQTIESLRGRLTGECAEVVEAVDLHDRKNLCEELGDLLMNIVFMAVVAEEEKAFTWEDVCKSVVDKMVRRHEHVFGSKIAESIDDVHKFWQQAKAAEKPELAAPESVFSKKILALSALDRATSIQKRAAKVNFDWHDAAGVMEKIKEETGELAEAFAAGDDESIDEELGDLLFAAVNLARFRQRASADELLRNSCRKFVDRFQAMEKIFAGDNIKAADRTLEEWELAYKQVKAQEKTKKLQK